jgi:putative Holliday junction resolvase
MSRLLGIDYGLKRVGLAVSDPLQIIATPLTTVAPEELISFLKDYLSKENVVTFVIGFPYTEDGSVQAMQQEVKMIKNKLFQFFPSIPSYFEDERYTSRMAQKTRHQMGVKKSKKKDKKELDAMSAAILLQSFMDAR